jgi:hypothetical protein
MPHALLKIICDLKHSKFQFHNCMLKSAVELKSRHPTSEGGTEPATVSYTNSSRLALDLQVFDCMKQGWKGGTVEARILHRRVSVQVCPKASTSMSENGQGIMQA